MNSQWLTDEQLASFLDCTTNEEGMRCVLQSLQTDATLREALTVALRLEEDAQQQSSSISTLNLQPSTLPLIPLLRLAADKGELPAAADILQTRNLCGWLCELYILRRRGLDVDLKQLLTTAVDNGWLRPEGTPLHAIGQLLAHQGQLVTHTYDATLDDIACALALDNDIIVCVDSDKLHPGQPDEEDAPNHALVVTGLDLAAETITLYDPAESAADSTMQTPSTDDNSLLTESSYPLSLFQYAWRESHNYLVRVLRDVSEYAPQPIDLQDIPLTHDLRELSEAIAENAHDLWAAARQKEGWTYGPQRDDTHQRHPDLVPYCALPESEKEYDRLMALNTIKLVQKLGFQIIQSSSL